MAWFEKNGHTEETTKKVLEYVNICQQFSPNDVDYRFFTDSVKELSGAVLVGLNLVKEEDESKTIVKAVSGAPEILSRLMNTLGFNLESTEWEVNSDEIKISERNKLIYFSSFKEIGYYDFLPRLAPVLKIIEKYLLRDGLYAIEFDYQEEFLGIITLIMPRGKALENKELLDLYIGQIAGTIKRLRAENKLQQKMIALWESEAKFRAYMEKAPLGIFVADHEGHYLEVNHEACQMSGYTQEELLNLTIPDFIAPEFLEKGMKSFERLLTEGYAEADIMVRKKNKDRFWINLSAVKVDSNKVIAFCQDITARKEKEERSKELNCLYNFSRLLRNEKNDLGKILEGTIKLLPSSFQYPEDVDACITFKEREFKTQHYEPTPWKISSHLELYGKQTGAINVCYRKIPQQKQDPFIKEEKLLLKTIAEHLSRVIEQIQAKEDLQMSNNQLSITLDSIGDGVIVTDASGKITRMNPQAEMLTGWAADKVLGRVLHEVFHIVNAKTGEPVPNPVYHVIQTGKTQGMVNDTVLIARDGTKYHIADSAAPMLDDGAKMFGVIMVFSDVTKRKKAEESTQYQLRFEKLLADVSNIFASQPSEHFDQSINHALELIGEFFQVDRSYVFQFFDDGKQMSNTHEWCAEGIEAQMDKIQGVPADKFSWLIEQIRKKKSVYIPDVDSLPPEAEAEKKEFQSQDIRSLLSIPMTKNSTVFGFLGLDAVKDKKIWTENHIMLLTVVADLILNAYTRSLTEEKMRYQSFHDSLTGLYNRIYLENEMKRLDTERQLPIGIIMADLNRLKLANDTFGHDMGDEMLKQTARILKDSCRGEDIIARWGGDEFVIFLPQTTEKDAKAICQRINEKCKETYVNDIPLSLALGAAIKTSTNKDLAETLNEAEEIMYRHKRTESQQIKSDGLKIMLNKLEAKSFETKAHYLAMQKAAQRIGKKAGLSQLMLSKLEVLVLLHDIGEINISEKILTKKGPLTAEEWAIIKKHPETGYRIARATGEPDEVAEDILSHHERWDGTGYPQGLKGEKIPLLARITAIADAYEVMNAGRPYKKAMSKSEIVAELKRCAGSQFDPNLTEIFLQYLETKINTND
ncbi:MAG: PAS domain S-box protein [Bacillota bacterium]|nr:PAS domain S-box protein [Bacillota bacterium]